MSSLILIIKISMTTHFIFFTISNNKNTNGIFISSSLCFFGGARRDRTDDLLLAKQALSQLSYGPMNDKAGIRL